MHISFSWLQNKEKRRIFEERMTMAKTLLALQPNSLPSYVRLLGRRFQADEMLKVIDYPDHQRQGRIEFEALFFSEYVRINDHGDSVDKLLSQDAGPYYHLDLGRDLLLPWPWNKQRISNCLAKIGRGKQCGDWRAELNHRVQLLLPVGIGIVYGGNHSLATGIVNGEGMVVNAHSVDLTPLYPHVYFDGVSYRRTADKRVVQAAANAEMGAIFEIGRLMVEHNIKFDGMPASEEDLHSQERRR